MIPTGIEDKYEVIQILRDSAATAVLLVNYKQIGALRILKAIHRAHPDAHSILSEAHLLQGIKSSQIPTIISVEDTNQMYYLVEEYVEGLSLQEYLLGTILSKEKLLKLSISLCNVVESLHNALPEPVIHRDLKPEHLILQGDVVKLIDFGISIKLSEAAKAKPLGTLNWAAPEQLKGERLDLRADIYSVGKIIEFMQTNSYAKDDIRIKKLVEKATAEEVDERIESISKLKEMLISLQKDRANEITRKGYLDKSIAVVGATNAVGTTHIAINLCRYLNKKKIASYYKDPKKDTVLTLFENLKDAKIKEGILYHDSFRGILNYGDAIEHPKPPIGLIIIDCGCDENLAIEADITIYVNAPAPWKAYNPKTWLQDKKVYIINNFADKLSCLKLAKELNKRVYRYPVVEGTRGLTKEEEKVFLTIFKHEKDFNF